VCTGSTRHFQEVYTLNELEHVNYLEHVNMGSSKWEYTVTHFKTFKDQVVVSWDGFELVALKMFQLIGSDWDYSLSKGVAQWNKIILGEGSSCRCF